MSYKIKIHIPDQRLDVYDRGELVKTYPVSTGRKGVGQMKESNQTPLGRHYIRAKIGEGQPLNTAFKDRRPTGVIYTPEIGAQTPGADWILTRIMWLSGLEKGYNRLGNVDTMQRYIYIHGMPEDRRIDVPGSHGCIRMRNEDVVDLFDIVPAGTEVEIVNT